MSRQTHSWLSPALAAAWLAAAACGAGEDPADPPDAAPVDPFGCEPRSGGDDELFDMTIGLRMEDSFVEIGDGDQCPVLLGSQGLYMFQGELRASVSFPTDSVCFDCIAEVSAFGDFDGITQPGYIGFSANTESFFSGFSTIILAGGAAAAEALEGAQVDISVSCVGHGYSGTVSRSVQLFLME
jgi:hypothetical protein